jgi:hypothetical protein
MTFLGLEVSSQELMYFLGLIGVGGGILLRRDRKLDFLARDQKSLREDYDGLEKTIRGGDGNEGLAGRIIRLEEKFLATQENSHGRSRTDQRSRYR